MPRTPGEKCGTHAGKKFSSRVKREPPGVSAGGPPRHEASSPMFRCRAASLRGDLPWSAARGRDLHEDERSNRDVFPHPSGSWCLRRRTHGVQESQQESGGLQYGPSFTGSGLRGEMSGLRHDPPRGRGGEHGRDEPHRAPSPDLRSAFGKGVCPPFPFLHGSDPAGRGALPYLALFERIVEHRALQGGVRRVLRRPGARERGTVPGIGTGGSVRYGPVGYGGGFRRPDHGSPLRALYPSFSPSHGSRRGTGADRAQGGGGVRRASPGSLTGAQDRGPGRGRGRASGWPPRR